jgi:hypothetical protein
MLNQEGRNMTKKNKTHNANPTCIGPNLKSNIGLFQMLT